MTWDGVQDKPRISVACVGSRDAPESALTSMEELGAYIAHRGFELKTGNAYGSDQAFARGANSVDPTKVWLFLPWKDYGKEAIREGNHVIDVSQIDYVPTRKKHFTKIASDHHPAWQYLKPTVHRLMVRNACIIWQANLVLAHLNHDKKGGGGTGHGWRIANTFEITRIDLSTEFDIEHIKKTIDALSTLDSGTDTTKSL